MKLHCTHWLWVAHFQQVVFDAVENHAHNNPRIPSANYHQILSRIGGELDSAFRDAAVGLGGPFDDKTDLAGVLAAVCTH